MILPQTNVRGHVFLVDDDDHLLKLLSIRLRASGFQVTAMDRADKALGALSASRPDVVLTDLKMPGKDGMDLFEEIHSTHPGLPVIIFTAHGTIPDAVAAVKRGIFGYLTKPFDAEELLGELDKAIQLQGSNNDTERWREGIVTKSPLIEEVLVRARRAAQTDASVLIQGESGTGKELLARAIHLASARAKGPFIAINCGAIPENLLESELFGHIKGSFTGAISDHKGLFASAQGGTVLLDEIGDMPLALQVKLLRVLESREVRPIGSTKSMPIDVRILAATHRDIQAMKEKGEFREDLFYRLNVVNLRLPSLAERPEDIVLLANHFLKQLHERYDAEARLFAPEALDFMVKARWPGNVRQLYNVVEQCVALCATEVIPVSYVEQALHAKPDDMDSFEDARRRFERDYLTRVLKLARGSVSEAARLAKRNRTEFYKLLDRHGIDVAMFKERRRADH